MKWFFLPLRQNLFYFSRAGKFCLAQGLGQLTRDVLCDVRTLNSRRDVTLALPRKKSNNLRREPLCDVKLHK